MRRPSKPLPPPADRPPYLVGYARVSTEDQNLDLQRDALLKAGVLPDDIHEEKVSGVAGKRPALDNAIASLRPGDVLVVWRLDRLGRSMRDLYERLDEIAEAGASFKSLTEHFDFTTATGQLVLGIFGIMAQFERQLTIERTRAGMAARKARGFGLGRPRKMDAKSWQKAFDRVKRGETIRETAAALGVSATLLRNHIKIDTDARGRRVVRWKQKPE